MVRKSNAVGSPAASTSGPLLERIAPFDFPEALSTEYFTALANCAEHERIPLLLLPEFTVPYSDTDRDRDRDYNQPANIVDPSLPSNQPDVMSINDSLIHTSCMSISPSTTNINPNVHPAQAYQYLTTISQSNLPAPLLHHNDDVRVYSQIRNVAAILAQYPNTCHQISNSGILAKLLSVQQYQANAAAHVEFLQCCIFAKQYHYAKRHFIPFPMPNAVSASVSASASTSASTNQNQQSQPNDEIYLRYHYLRGIIYFEGSSPSDIQCAINEWSHCITTPAHEMSAIALSAWKKMVLAKCILCQYDDEEALVEHYRTSRKKQVRAGSSKTSSSDGRTSQVTPKKSSLMEELKEYVLALPLGASHAVIRFFKKDFPQVQMYKTLVDQYIKNELNLDLQLQETSNVAVDDGDVNITDSNTNNSASSVPDVFHDDGNVDMVKRLIPAMSWRKLRALSKVYDNIPLGRLGHQLGFDNDPQQCKEFLMRVGMIQRANSNNTTGSSSGIIPIEFSIDDEAGTVYFDEEDLDGTMGQELVGKIEECMTLAKRVKQLDVELASSHKYRTVVAKHANSQKNKKSGSGGGDRDGGKAMSVIDM